MSRYSAEADGNLRHIVSLRTSQNVTGCYQPAFRVIRAAWSRKYVADS
jgi:hypothetical protein